MKDMYWIHEGATLKASGVPDDAVPFGVGAECPRGHGRITMIDRCDGSFGCTCCGRCAGFPRLTITVDRTDLIIDDALTRGRQIIAGEVHRG